MRVFHLLHQAHQTAFRTAEQRLRASGGVSTPQLLVLLVLQQEDGLTMSELSERTARPASSLSGLVDRMVDKGLVRRTVLESDARVQLVHLEQSGTAATARVLPYVREVNEVLLAPFDEEERGTIERFLHHVAGSADALK